MTQTASVYTDLTVTQNLRYFARLAGVPASGTREAVTRAVATVDLGALVADTTPDELLRTTGAPDAERAFLALVERAPHEGVTAR